MHLWSPTQAKTRLEWATRREPQPYCKREVTRVTDADALRSYSEPLRLRGVTLESTVVLTMFVLLAFPALGAQTPKTDEMTAKKMCADQADKRESELRPTTEGFTITEYQQHYDRVRNLCYLRYDVHGPTPAKDGYITMATVIDAFEDHVFAACTFTTTKGRSARDVGICFVHPPTSDGIIRFTDSLKWERTVEKYFGVGATILKEMGPTFSNGRPN